MGNFIGLWLIRPMFKEILVHQSLRGSVINQISGRTGKEFQQLSVSQEPGDVFIGRKAWADLGEEGQRAGRRSYPLKKQIY